MALKDMIQPELISIQPWLRLRKYDGNFALFLSGYQNPVVYQNSEGIFDESRIPDLAYVERMCRYLAKAGELYYIEVLENGQFTPIGDVTVKEENPPIAIWRDEYRDRGIGTMVMEAVISRLRELGCGKITGSTVYRWNLASQRLHEKLGFVRIQEVQNEIIYQLELCNTGSKP